jgi:hypothetical protein
MRFKEAKTGPRNLCALPRQVLGEEAPIVLVLVEISRRQHGRKHRHVAVELHAHERIDERGSDELVPVDPALTTSAQATIAS